MRKSHLSHFSFIPVSRIRVLFSSAGAFLAFSLDLTFLLMVLLSIPNNVRSKSCSLSMINDQNFLMYKIGFSGNFCPVRKSHLVSFFFHSRIENKGSVFLCWRFFSVLIRSLISTYGSIIDFQQKEWISLKLMHRSFLVNN